MIKKKLPFFGALFIFSLFLLISYWTPLAGDDWGYAVNGMSNNPLTLAFEFYSGWSGRFFSELYGFLVTPHKWFWNILNPSLFALIFYNIIKITKPKYTLMSILFVLMWMLSVKDELRMETYSWLMGTTYVIPLALSLIFIYQVKDSILKAIHLSIIKQALLGFLLFYIGLTMENISVVMFFLVALIFLYLLIKDRTINWTWLRFSLISLSSLLILRLSPGAALRLARDHAEWTSLSLFEQIQTNYPLFIQHTFIDNKWFTLSFTLILCTLVFQSTLKNGIKTLLASALSLAVISSLSLTLYTKLNWSILTQFTDTTSLLNMIYWPIYIIILFLLIWTQLKNSQKLIALFFVLAAGLANGSMLLSPIFGYRSSLFTLYFMMIVGIILFNELKIHLAIYWLLPVLLSAMVLKDTFNLYNKYHLVHETDLIRLEQIQYYKDNPNVKEAWLIRYPIFTIHSGDIEEWDSYHMQVFKQYYGLADDVKLIFYYPE